MRMDQCLLLSNFFFLNASLIGKIVPDWLPPREPGKLTYRVPPEPPKKEAKTEKSEAAEDKSKEEDEEEKESITDRFGRILGRK